MHAAQCGLCWIQWKGQGSTYIESGAHHLSDPPASLQPILWALFFHRPTQLYTWGAESLSCIVLRPRATCLALLSQDLTALEPIRRVL
jgi:hypothetical protein